MLAQKTTFKTAKELAKLAQQRLPDLDPGPTLWRVPLSFSAYWRDLQWGPKNYARFNREVMMARF